MKKNYVFMAIIVFLSMINVPDSYSIPLPSNAGMAFSGTFSRSDLVDGGWSGNNLQEVAIFGFIDFSLEKQVDYSFTMLDEVEWFFRGKSNDGLFDFNGLMDNESQLEFADPDSPYASWANDWNQSVEICDNLTGFDITYYWPASIFGGDDWDLTNNSNFLPSYMFFEVASSDFQYVGRLEIDLLAAPVPEPSMILLLVSGLLFICIFRRDIFLKKIMSK